MYYQFLANVVFSGHQKRIVPMPMTSRIASQLLAEIACEADFIYLDGSHEYDDVISDLRGYWPLLRQGGILCGDDREWRGVDLALRDFSKETVYYDDSGWSIFKGLRNP